MASSEVPAAGRVVLPAAGRVADVPEQRGEEGFVRGAIQVAYRVVRAVQVIYLFIFLNTYVGSGD